MSHPVTMTEDEIELLMWQRYTPNEDEEDERFIKGTLTDLICCQHFGWIFFVGKTTLFYAKLLAYREVDPEYYDKLFASGHITPAAIENPGGQIFYWGELKTLTVDSLMDYLPLTGQWYCDQEKSRRIATKFLNTPSLWDRTNLYPVSAYKPVEIL